MRDDKSSHVQGHLGANENLLTSPLTIFLNELKVPKEQCYLPQSQVNQGVDVGPQDQDSWSTQYPDLSI